MKKSDRRRVLLKLSGEALGEPEDGKGLSLETIRPVAEQIAEGAASGVQVAIVTGGGNLWRGARLEGLELERTGSDTVGMLGTVMNSVALGEVLRSIGAEVRVLSAIGPEPLVERYSIARGREALECGQVVLVAGGTSNPYFTTDSAAALRALELEADILLKATNVDGVYSEDPRKDPSARLYEHLDFGEAVEKQLRIMDIAAFALCQEGDLPIFVFNMRRSRGIVEAILGEGPGTHVSGRKQHHAD